MREDNFREEQQFLGEWLNSYEKLRSGAENVFLEEDVFLTIIEYFDELDKVKKAMEAVDIALQYYPYSTPLMVKKADYLIVYKHLDEAMAVLDQATIYDNQDVNIYILKTEALLAMKKNMEAKEILESAMNLFEGEELVDLLFELADVFDDYELYNDVFNCLASVLEIDPNNEEALYKICFWTDFTNRHYEGIQIYKRIIDAYPYNDLAWFNLGAAYQCIKRYEKALDAYEYAIAINEKFDYAYRNIGDAYIRLRKYKEAIESLERVLELAKPEDVIYEAIGYCYEKLKNYAQARFYFRKASHLNEDKGALLYKIALTYYKEDQFEQCIRQLEAALKIRNNNPEFLLLMGQSKLALGLDKDALQYFLNVVRLRPKQLTGWESLLIGLYKAGLFEEGLAQIENAVIRLGAEKPLFHYYKALFYFGLNQPKQAQIEFEEGLIKGPRLLKRILEVEPALLQRPAIGAMILKNKKRR